VGSVTAGALASLALSPLWAVPLAATVVGSSVVSPRVVMFAAGVGQIRSRWHLLLSVALIALPVAAFGMLGGLAATLGQRFAGRALGHGVGDVPSVASMFVLVLTLAASAALGALLASAFRRVAIALLVYFGSLMVTVSLVTGAYYVSTLRYPASLAPWAPLFVFGQRQVVARDLWLDTNGGVSVLATIVWLAVLVVLAGRRFRNEVS
jgi:hypothetical protein